MKLMTHCSTEMTCRCFSILDLQGHKAEGRSCRADRMLEPVPGDKGGNKRQVTQKLLVMYPKWKNTPPCNTFLILVLAEQSQKRTSNKKKRIMISLKKLQPSSPTQATHQLYPVTQLHVGRPHAREASSSALRVTELVKLTLLKSQ